jgi:hypothetical protein
MKIGELPVEKRKQFREHVPIYHKFIKENSPHLSTSSHNLYSRALAFIAVENDLLNYTPEQLCIKLTQEALTTSDFIKIIGTDNHANQNIRLSAFRNLVEPYKESLKNKISEVSYNAISKLVSRKGTHIRRNILESKSNNLKSDTELLNMRSWKELQTIINKNNQSLSVILAKFFRTNEIPCYNTLRDILIGNLYCNNYHEYKNMRVHTILRNEYKSCYLWINPDTPPEDKKNYFWINISGESKIVIQKSKTIGGVKRGQPNQQGETEILPQKSRKIYPLNKNIVSQILFLKQTFNERIETPFLKNNTRDGIITDGQYNRILYSIFKDLAPQISCTTIRKIYYNEVKWHQLSTHDANYILRHQDHNKSTCDIFYKKINLPKEDSPIIDL